MLTRNAVVRTVGILLRITSALAICALPIWVCLVPLSLAYDPYASMSEIVILIATPYLLLAALWAFFLIMAWGTNPGNESRTPVPPS
jgi:peptidoglycan biosynthesis protein MviN/MurJ (putative lipid II flippase)